MKKQKKIRCLRRIAQLLFLSLFLYLLTNTSYPMKTPVTTEMFLRLSPLISLTTMVAGRAVITLFWVSLIVLALSIVLGRYFCGWVCPLGTTFDITDRLLVKARKKPYPPLRKTHHVKYYVLVAVLCCAVFGVNLSGLFDPISWSTRIYGLVVHPSAYFLSDHAAMKIGWRPLKWLQHMALHPQSEMGSFSQPYFQHTLTIVVLFVVVILAGLVMRRFYCRVVCPLGALFSVISRFSILRRYTSDACIECGNCLRECKMGAIGNKGRSTMTGECVQCLDCDTVCPVDCIYWNPVRKGREHLEVTSRVVPIDLSRRELLGSILGSLAALPIVRLALATERGRIFKKPELAGPASRVIRPPGAPEEAEFLSQCVKCGQCMKVCPTNGLQPLLLEQGLEGLWTPALVPRIGYCEFTCGLCMEVCPTGAIEQLPLKNKQHFALGKARFDRNKCIPWDYHSRWREGDEWRPEYNCRVCEEHCPARDEDGNKAILLTWKDIPESEGAPPPLPYTNTRACIGCGQCENVCPVEGEAAIRVWRTDDRGIPAWARELL